MAGKFPLTYEALGDGRLLKPQYVIERLRDLSPDDTIVTSGVGQHQMFASQYWHFNHPYTWINSGWLGTMGFSIPAAVGAKAGMPDRTVWAIDGDGCFQMTAQELVTASVERIPIKVALLNNATSEWSSSGRTCSTTNVAVRSTWATNCRTTSSGPKRWVVLRSVWKAPRKWTQ